MTWLRATLNKTTARSASMRASGASTERRERYSSRSSVQHSPRKDIISPLSFVVEHNSMAGGRTTITSALETTELPFARELLTIQAT